MRRNFKNRSFKNGGRRNGGGGGGGSRPSSANIAQTLQRAKQAKEKYLQLARESLAAGDRIQAENYFQYADHYTRVQNGLSRERENGQEQQRFVAEEVADSGTNNNSGESGTTDAQVSSSPAPAAVYAEANKETEPSSGQKEFLPAFLLTEV